MNENQYKAIFYFSLSFLLFWLIKPKTKVTNVGAKRLKIEAPVVSEEDLSLNEKGHDAIIALRAYIDAWNNDESEQNLQKLISEIKNEFNLVVYKKGDRVAVKDLEGNDILISK